MNKTLYMAGDRGFSNLGWLKSWHTFNFANFYHEDRQGFGRMIVLNENILKPSSEFGTRTCDNIEIISLPLSGNLSHKNDLDLTSVLGPGDVQVISAGKGLVHADQNPSKTENLHFIEIWVLPGIQDLPPRYRLGHFGFTDGEVVPVILPAIQHGGLSINQQFWLYAGKFRRQEIYTHQIHDSKNGIFIHMISGSIITCGEKLTQGDAIGLRNLEAVGVECPDEAMFLIMEIPVDGEPGADILENT